MTCEFCGGNCGGACAEEYARADYGQGMKDQWEKEQREQYEMEQQTMTPADDEKVKEAIARSKDPHTMGEFTRDYPAHAERFKLLAQAATERDRLREALGVARKQRDALFEAWENDDPSNAAYEACKEIREERKALAEIAKILEGE